MKKAFLLVLAGVVILGISAISARADSMTFTGGQTGNGGVLEWDGGSPLGVVDAVIESVFLTSLGPNFAHDVDAFMTFVTGPQLSCSIGGVACPPGPAGGVITATFGGGGSFSVVGSVDDFGIPDGTTLLSGVFLPGSLASFTLLPMDDSGNMGIGADGGTFKGLLDITGIDPVLLAALGFPPGFTQGDGSLFTTFVEMLWTQNDEGYFAVDATVDLATVEVTPIPEPGTLLLFGTGLFVGALFLRKRVFALEGNS